jgi:hypothetical protein
MPFHTDPRGAVVTGTVTEHKGARRVAYFHATVSSDGAREVQLRVSSVDDLAMWLNGEFLGFFKRSNTAWWDFLTNPQHRVDQGRVQLRDGTNQVLVRVVGGTYATGGFFLGFEPTLGP